MKPFDGQEIAVFSDDALARDPALSLFQKILLSTDGTVTGLLSLYARRPLRARKVAQSLEIGILDPASLGAAGVGRASAATIDPLDAAPHERILRRTIVLGSEGDGELLFADSRFMFDRFSQAIQDGLLHTELPIGLLWRRERLETYREIVDCRSETCAPVAALLGVPEGSLLYARTYVIYHQRRPLGVITEKFAASVLR